MKLLIFSFYFPPDLCAGSFRCGALVDALARRMPPDCSVDVVTTQPNRYKGAIDKAAPFEDRGRVRIHRIALPEHDSGMVDQAKSYMAFSARALAIAKDAGPHDAVFATTSRLMTGAVGAAHARRTGAPLYLDIRDLFVDTLTDVLAGSRARLVLPLIRRIERFALGTASRINLVSPGFEPDVAALAPNAAMRSFTNGIDDEFLEIPARSTARPPAAVPTIIYAGNIGEGQGLDCVVPDAARRLRGRARFRIIGQGGRLEHLRSQAAQLENVELVPAMPRAKLLREYEAADILFLHLNDYAAFRKVLPSKLFEYGALGHPILAGLSGVSAEFIAEELPDTALFMPCDGEGLAASLPKLQAAGAQDRSAFRNKFARHAIMDRMAEDLLDFAREAKRR